MKKKVNVVWIVIGSLLVISLFLFISKATYTVGTWLFAISALWGIGYFFYRGFYKGPREESEQRRKQEEEQKNREKQEQFEIKADSYRAILKRGKPEPELYKITNKEKFSCEEEQRLTMMFNSYLEKLNKNIIINSQIEWLETVKEAQSFLSLTEELKRTESMLELAEKKLQEQNMDIIVLPTAENSAESSATNIMKQQFMALIKPIRRVEIDILKGFFSKMTVGFIPISTDKAFILCLQYIAAFDCITNTIHILQYSDFIATIETFTEELSSSRQLRADDDVVDTRYAHQTLSGRPDRRWSYNPPYIVVRRAKILFQSQDYEGYINFTNKQKAEDFLTRFETYRLSLYEYKRTRRVSDLKNPQIFEKKLEIKHINNVGNIANTQRTAITNVSKTHADEKALSMEDLSNDEISLILERRQTKERELQEQEKQRKILREQAAIEFNGVNIFEPTDELNIITNNIFSFNYRQVESIEGDTKYEFVFVDLQGNPVSTSTTIERQVVGKQIKITFSLLANKEIDAKATYYLLIRCRETNDGVLRGKIKYKINISFSNEFGI